MQCQINAHIIHGILVYDVRVYVDNIIVIWNHKKTGLALKQRLVIEFKMKELGRLKYFMEIEVAYSKEKNFYFSIEVHCWSFEKQWYTNM